VSLRPAVYDERVGGGMRMLPPVSSGSPAEAIGYA
jgi:hypothetical protein